MVKTALYSGEQVVGSAWGLLSKCLFPGPDKGNLEAPSVRPAGASFSFPGTWHLAPSPHLATERC